MDGFRHLISPEGRTYVVNTSCRPVDSDSDAADADADTDAEAQADADADSDEQMSI